jgi:hypothetical protein
VDSTSRRKRIIIELIFAGSIVIFIAYIIALNFGCHCTDKADTIVNYLGQLDAAKSQWAIDHKGITATNLSWNDLSPYVETNFLNRSFAGETYLINQIGEPVSALIPKKTDWIPANSEVRFGPDQKVQIRSTILGSPWISP